MTGRGWRVFATARREADLAALPYRGAYVCSKFALEG